MRSNIKSKGDLSVLPIILFLVSLLPYVDLFAQTFHKPKIDTFTITLPPNAGTKPYYSSWRSNGSEGSIWLVDKGQNEIIEVDPNRDSILFRLPFRKSGIGEVRTFTFYGEDSILIFSKNADHRKCLFWLDQGKNQLTPVPYFDHLHLIGAAAGDDTLRYESLSGSSSTPLTITNGIAILGIQPYYPPEKIPYGLNPLFMTYDVKAGLFQKLPLFLPKGYHEYPTDLGHRTAHMIAKGDSILITYSGSPDLAIFDLTQDSITSHKLPVPGLKMDNPPQPDFGMHPLFFLLKSGHYGRLFYHKHLRIFLRVVYFPTEPYDSDREIFKTIDDRKAGVFIWDEHFIPQAYFDLPDGSNDRNAFCTRQGFAILVPNLTKSTPSGTNLSYIHYNYE